MSAPRIHGSLDERFWAKVQPAEADECWLWIASLNDAGYGQINIGGRPHRAHRVAYELLRAEIPTGLQIDHLCRVRRCVNPWHLEPVTNEVNMQRGNFLVTRAPLKEKCRNGHPFSPQNTRRDPQGYRRCRACERAQSLAKYHRRKAAA